MKFLRKVWICDIIILIVKGFDKLNGIISKSRQMAD